MAKRHTNYTRGTGCPVEAALEIIGGKWKGGVVYHLLSGELRFMELQRRMPTVSQRILSKALRELEADGVILRTVYPTVPPQVGYRLTADGESLRAAVLSLREWGARRVAPPQAALATAAE
ncbi:DNA-binding HxlR family transcriptional regulator [Ancylobacter sp. 3268]|uniref:winged helix-turn-helix transcriptional regulator n=1 Tax=Ancylobacter sp. 3268 TaxID=2817752 RepID=UPI002860734C|nr:helix-turn-helix domain-containing protein [Ancylobacter sp. 3268]MDR6954218.1 DNA-binding HxlR family transcriptional regulator [Ancylobacter sp. 3268]